ncbi:MAG: hypothetical protein R6U36_01555, partial [Candidatus Fermentibacteraceae bacterium]
MAAVAFFLSLSLVARTGSADDFPDHTLPTMVVRMRGPQIGYDDMKLPLLTTLTWRYFDATNFGAMSTDGKFDNFLSLCDSVYIRYSICAGDVMRYVGEWGGDEYRYWFRNSPDEGLLSDECFAQSDIDFEDIINYASADTMFDSNEEYSLSKVMGDLASNTSNHPCLWFFEVYDEANNKQWGAAVSDTSSLDDYIPNIYTQDRDPATKYLTMEEVEPAGIFSWQKWLVENDAFNPVTFTLNMGVIRSYMPEDYRGLDYVYGTGTMADQARAVRTLMEARYQPPPVGSSIPVTLPNPLEFLCFDYYPFRYVDRDYVNTTTICDSDWEFLVGNCEEGMDSTVMNAVVGGDPIPVYYYTQAFGASSGPKMHGNSSDSVIDYNSLLWRNPTSQEFRMLCNLALLHQAKGIFPYSLCSFIHRPNQLNESWNYGCNALLDRHLIPFDAPYEDWVYTGRWPEHDTYDYSYIRPDSIPPWMDGFDPLYDVESAPQYHGMGDQKYNERWYEWLFEPYGILWSEIGGIMAGVKRIAPEMHDLWWCGAAYRDQATITLDAASQPLHFVPPRIKVFEDSAQTGCWLFYVDRFCRSNDTPYEIGFDPDSLPAYADCSDRLLDHSRRFVMDGTWDAQTGLYTFLDTLDAGESRLVEPFDPKDGLPADIRITEGDVRTIRPQRGDTVSAMATTAGNSIDILA